MAQAELEASDGPDIVELRRDFLSSAHGRTFALVQSPRRNPESRRIPPWRLPRPGIRILYHVFASG